MKYIRNFLFLIGFLFASLLPQNSPAQPQSQLSDGLSAIGLAELLALVQAASVPNAQQAYVKSSNSDVFDLFGYSVSISGDTAVVGARSESSNATSINGDQTNNSAVLSGAAYVFVRSGSTWTQQAYLKASNAESGDSFGNSVSVYGDTIVVGAPGEDSNATGINGIASNNSKSGAGAAYVFVRSGTTWTQQAYLKASNTGVSASFGASVSLFGETVLIGAQLESSAATGVNGNQSDTSASGSGAAYVFVRNGTTWTQEAYLKASNTNAGDSFGRTVALYGDTAVVGAVDEDSASTGVNGDGSDDSKPSSGAVYVFSRTGTTWTPQSYLKASNTDANDKFGSTLAIYGDTLAVGAWDEDSGARAIDGDQSDNSTVGAGAVYVFVRTDSTWSQQAYLKASNADAGDNFGISLAIEGDALLVGASGEESSATGIDGDSSINTTSNAGAVYAFARTGSSWSQRSYIKASNTDANDYFGTSVAISGNTTVIGAFGEASNATGINGDQSNNSLDRPGAVYIMIYNPTEQLANGGFNTFTGKSKIPSGWKASKSFGSADGKSKVRKEGTAAVMLSGSAAISKTLTQKITSSGNAGDSITFGFWSKGLGVAKSGAWQATVSLYNGVTRVSSKKIKCPRGTFKWKNTSTTFAAAGAYTSVVVKFTLKTSGKAWLDAVSLVK